MSSADRLHGECWASRLVWYPHTFLIDLTTSLQGLCTNTDKSLEGVYSSASAVVLEKQVKWTIGTIVQSSVSTMDKRIRLEAASISASTPFNRQIQRFNLVICLLLLLNAEENYAFSPLHARAYPLPNKRLHLLSGTKSPDLITRQNLNNPQITVLSKDPLVYTISNFLSTEECQAFQDYVVHLPESRPMTRSNPPDVSLDMTKLWPLPFLSILAGIPPVYRLIESSNNSNNNFGSPVSSPVSLNDVITAALPNVLIALTLSAFLAFGVMLPLLRNMAASSSRTSDAVALNQPCDFDLIRSLVNRIAAVTDHSWEKWEAPVVTRYVPGAIFAKHGDASPTRGSEWEGLGGQRVITCICYLQTLEKGRGGETYFDKLKVAVQPVAGTALVFFPADSVSWLADDRTTHESLPPNEEKWIVQMFGRGQRVPHPLGLPDSYQDYID